MDKKLLLGVAFGALMLSPGAAFAKDDGITVSEGEKAAVVKEIKADTENKTKEPTTKEEKAQAEMIEEVIADPSKVATFSFAKKMAKFLKDKKMRDFGCWFFCDKLAATWCGVKVGPVKAGSACKAACNRDGYNAKVRMAGVDMKLRFGTLKTFFEEDWSIQECVKVYQKAGLGGDKGKDDIAIYNKAKFEEAKKILGTGGKPALMEAKKKGDFGPE